MTALEENAHEASVHDVGENEPLLPTAHTSRPDIIATVSVISHPVGVNAVSKPVSDAPWEDNRDRFAPGFWDASIPHVTIHYHLWKRFFDIIISLVALVIGSPIILIAALLVRFTSAGPVLFKQVRVGMGGRHFWCYKFRSMCVDAEAQKAQLLHLNETDGPVFKIKNDPRITPVGRLLRKFSIDELPQFFNVLKGDMSIVGPRPPLPSEVALYGARERGRLAVRPGLTCLWQVSGRSSIGFDRWMELDLLYIETMSFRNDVKIVLQTVPAVLKGSGAH